MNVGLRGCWEGIAKLDLPIGIRCSDRKRDDEDKTNVKTMESNSRRISLAAHWFNGLILTIFTLNKTVKNKIRIYG